MQFGCISAEKYFLLKINQGNAKYLENKPQKHYNGLWRTNATYASKFQIAKILEIKCNLGVFLLKIDQGNAKKIY